MPIIFPPQPGPGPGPSGQFTIGDSAGEVILKLENRTTDLARAYQWFAEGILEITSDGELREEFDQLEVLGPMFILTPGVRELPFSNFVNSPDYNDGTLNMRIWTDPPMNTTSLRLRFISYQEGDNYSNNRGRPTAWYRFADLVGFDMIPDTGYAVQMRYQRQYPFSDPIESTPWILPLDWFDVAVLIAVQRGFIELNEYEKSEAVYKLLHGDPKDPTRIGLINRRKKRFQREAWRQETGLRPWVGTYSRGATK